MIFRYWYYMKTKSFFFVFCSVADPGCYPGSELFLSWVPEPGSKRFPDPHPHQRIEVQYFNPKNCIWALGNMIRDVHPGSGSWFFTHPGAGSATLIFCCYLWKVLFYTFFLSIVVLFLLFVENAGVMRCNTSNSSVIWPSSSSSSPSSAWPSSCPSISPWAPYRSSQFDWLIQYRSSQFDWLIQYRSSQFDWLIQYRSSQFDWLIQYRQVT